MENLEHIGFWVQFVESRQFAFLKQALIFSVLVAVATLVIGAAIIFVIEASENAARRVRGWLRETGKTIWA